ncbi:hypothetical protein DFH08DRAFT_966788 [Mycena albidolilacea]|uniref:Uncharacterized protein n=1 Tax=Mycena albidolilacea TaxID=1033008 RepID=A0AAD6ZNS0_9AGAR|nr:hypothetical protein DFH08DRAFT_966788 [Mycena albidolilacea]
MDFSPLLQAHPRLTAVTLNIEGICVPPDISMDTTTTFLSRLDSFTGSVKNCAAVSPHARGLRQLTVLFPADASGDPQNTLDHQSPRPFTPTVFPPQAFPGVTSLDARAVDPNGGTARYAWTFLPDSLICLADAFPNLTRLEVSLAGSLHDYCAGFAALQMLEQLSVRVHKHPPMSDYGRRAAELYPADALKLGRLPVLAEVHVLLWVDRSDTYITGCESCDEYQDVWWDLEVEYWFERRVDIVGEGEEGFSLVRMTASDEKEGDWGMIDI